MNLDIEIESEITCPYCKVKGHDSWEAADSNDMEVEDDRECDSCGKIFHWRRVVTIDYRSNKDCDLNQESHDYKKAVTRNGEHYECEKCGNWVKEIPGEDKK
jgi:hypothetical protein